MRIVMTGANRGIGAELAKGYRAAGHDVTGTARDGSGDAILDVTNPKDHAALGSLLD